jgi:hypothetical protein
MKLLSCLLLVSVATTNVSAFSAVAPNKVSTAPAKKSADATAPDDSVVDRSMKGIDTDTNPRAFDPTNGENPALIRNNKDGVWVPQVIMIHIDHQNSFPTSLSRFYSRNDDNM